MQKILQTSFFLLVLLITSKVNAADYYWVGGKGNWNDASHWSHISGGIGGAGIPNNITDNVTFDENSFTAFGASVFINSNIDIQNFTVNNAHNFKIYSNHNIQLNINGNWSTNSSFRNKIEGEIHFLGTGTHQLYSNNEFNCDLVFDNGNYNLITDLLTNGNIEFNNGHFNANGKAIKGESISIRGGNNQQVNLNGSIIITNNFIEPSSTPNQYYSTNTSTQFINNNSNQNRGTNICGNPPFTVTTTVITDYNGYGVSCNGASDGIVCVTVTGGVGPFSINWLGGGPQGTYGDGISECYTGIDAGTYSVIITDQGQGTAPVFVPCGTSQQVAEPGEITLLSWTSSDPSCNGVCDGSATPIIFGDVPPFVFDWSSGETTQTAVQLCVGQNDLTVTDDNGCTFDTTFFILTPTAVLANVTTTNASCFNVCDGVAYSNPSGGNGSPYTFAWSNGSNGAGPLEDSITGLCNGNYSVTVTDNNGCTGVQNFSITEPLQIIVTITGQTNLICNGVCSGAITTSTTNGTPGYTYQWFDAISGLPVFGQTNPNASGLCAGDYFVQVTDANGCQDVSPTVTLTQPPAITSTPTATDIQCFGQCNGVLSIISGGGTGTHTYNWIDANNPPTSVGTGNPLNGMCAGNYFAEITDANGCIVNSLVVTIDEPPVLSLVVTPVDILCNNFCTGSASAVAGGGTGALTIEWFTLPGNVSLGTGNNVANLCNGNYYAEVTDINGCSDTVQFSINEPTPLTVVIETSTDVQCNGACDGTTIFDITGGTPPYNIEWFDVSTGLTINQFGTTASNLCPGDYFAIATDANNCTIQSNDLNVTEPTPLAISITSTNVSCNSFCDGTATIVVNGGTPVYTITWLDQFNNPIGQSGLTASNLCPGDYHADVLDANNCPISSNTVTITEPLALSGIVNTTDVTCNNDCDGIAVAVPAGGFGPFTYSWSSSINTTDTENNLCAGNYDVTITDFNGCPFGPINFTINENTAYTFDLTVTNPTCFGDCDGSATVSNIVGEGGIYGVTWSSSANTLLTENGLCVANYTLTITDQNGCDTIHDFNITEPTPLILTPNFADPTCAGICNGTASANPSGATPPYTFSWVDLVNGPMATTTDTISNLCPGDYEVTVTDANGCSDVTSFTITDPGGISGTTVPTPASCGAVCDGEVDLTIVGGAGPYNIDWIDATSGVSTGITSNPATNLCAGNYYAIITDANGCSVLSDTSVVTQTVIVDGTMIVTDPSCFGSCDGNINLTPNGGNLPYTFAWFDQATLQQIQNTEDATGLCSGNYFVVITDANGCSSAPLIETLTEPTQITVVLSGTDASCFGVCNGSITSLPAGGNAPYTFQWINASTGTPIGQTTQNAANLCAGDYELIVTDANGCSITSNIVTISEPTELIGNLTVNDASCFGVCDGSANFAVVGGNLPYTFTWSSSGNTTDTENGLCAGNYTVSITDGNGCVLGPNNFTIDEPVTLTVSAVGSAVLCNGDCNGTATATPVGGTAPYTYQWNAAAGSQTTQIATGLCAGNYNVVVTDANGCTTLPSSATVTEPNALTLNNISTTDATCGGICDGTATVSANGGTSPYTFLWDDPLAQTTATAISLCAGSYNVIISDNNGCSTAPIPVTVNEPNALTVSVNISDETCFNACDGIATAIVAGGTGASTFQWDDPTLQTTNPATGLCGGTYTVEVTDANGCSASASGTVNSAVEITATTSSTLAQCGVCDGTATVNASGGNGVLNIQWDAAAANQTTTTATALCAGVFTVDVTDANGCTETFSAAVSNPNGETISVSSTDASCLGNCDGTGTVTFVCSTPGCTILWNDPLAQTTVTATGLCAGSYGVAVTNGAGCITADVITIDEPDAIDVNLSSTDVICNGDCNGTASSIATGGDGNYSYLWDDPSSQTNPAALNLCSGTYTLIVTDGNGCTGTGSTIINDPVILSATVSSNDASCNASCDGSGTVFPVGGVAPYTFVWDDPASQTTQTATGLCAGTYNVTVIDAGGCTFGPLSITINEPSAFVGNISATALNCNGDCDGTATLNLVGGNAPYSYLWDDPSAQTSSTAIGLCAGSYNVIVTDVNGCVTNPFGITIAEPAALSITMVSTNVDCFGNCNGSATATVTGGILPYNFVWDDPASQTTTSAFNLCAGTFNVDVTDANGCIVSSPATITEPNVLTSGASSSDVSCFGQCDGAAAVAPTGGTSPYTFLWSDGSGANNISALCPGNYDVDITDANGCNTSQSFIILEPTEITATATAINSTCNTCNGSASVSPVGGTGPYTYQWDAAAGSATTQTVNNLCAGIYSVTITDATGCSITVGIAISDNNAETVNLTFTDASCFGVCDGTVLANTACLDAPCTFQWFDGSGVNLNINVDNASNLCADNYFVQVTNATGCITVATDTIHEPDEIEGNGVVTDAACATVCDGQVALNPTGGDGSFTYLWNDPGAQTTQIATGLCGGTVDVAITSAGCTITESYFINQPSNLSASVSTVDAQCNLTCNGSATVTVTGGDAPFTFLWNDGAAQTTQTAINLCAGNYDVTITDANGCSIIESITINEPPALTATFSSTDVDCFGNCNGTSTVNPGGGIIPYTVQWDDPLLQTTLTATGLCAGNYNVVVSDATGCSTLPFATTVNENAILDLTVSSTDATCNTFCDGTITAVGIGGDGNYLFSIDGGANFQPSGTFNNQCAGAYTVLIVDGSGCSGTASVNVNEPSSLGGSVTSFNATCTVANGSANAVPTGGTPGYSFVWMDNLLNPIGQTTQGATGLAAGTYNVLVTDANGCTITLSATISNFNAPTITLNSVTDASCNGDCNGAIDMNVTGGTPVYSYLWIPNGQTTEDISNVCAGNYMLQVTDAAGCIAFGNASIVEPNILDATFNLVDATCGACDGTAVVNATGGDGNYTFDWTNGQTGTNASNLCAGAYGVQVTDGAGCSAVVNFSINNPTGPTGENIVSTNASCAGICDGTATVTPIGGTAPYTFFWVHDGTTVNNVTNLCAGTYFCEVTDANGCIRITNVVITEGTPMTDSTVITPATCGACDGNLSIFMSSGNGPFTFQWDAAAGNSTNQNVPNLCEGLYSVTVTDGVGCTEQFTYSINGDNAPQLSVTTTDANCNGNCDGSATITITGGAGPFTDDWLDNTGTSIGSLGLTNSTLCGGDYFIEITDQTTGCISTIPFTIDQPENLQFSLPFIQDNSCFASCDGIATAIVIEGTLPYTYVWTDPATQTTASATSLCVGTFDVTVTDANGCTGTQSATITEPTQVTMAFVPVDASCSTVNDGSVDVTAAGGTAPYTYSWTGPNNFSSTSEDLTNIFMGMYYLTTTDANGCSQTDSVFINALVIVNADAGPDTTICGSLPNFTVNGSGGVTYEWYDTTGTLLASTASYSFVPASSGTTTLILFAYDGLCTDSDTIDITINPIPNADAGPDVFTISGTPVGIGGSPTGPIGSIYDWTPGITLNDSTISNPSAMPDSTTTYVVTVTDINGCVANDTMVVTILPPIIIPNGFSPNGDGTNDVWEIDYISFFPDCQVEVYNRWGQLLFISVGYTIPWDGTYNNQTVPIGTYYYVINLNHPLFPDAYTGPLTILR